MTIKMIQYTVALMLIFISITIRADLTVEINQLLAPIKSSQNLEAFNKEESPLNALPKEARQDFLDSLTFNERGLTGFNYHILETQLSPSQIYKILALFGSQHLTPKFQQAEATTPLDHLLLEQDFIPYGDHLNYECISRATCAYAQQRICMSSCYH